MLVKKKKIRASWAVEVLFKKVKRRESTLFMQCGKRVVEHIFNINNSGLIAPRVGHKNILEAVNDAMQMTRKSLKGTKRVLIVTHSIGKE